MKRNYVGNVFYQLKKEKKKKENKTKTKREKRACGLCLGVIFNAEKIYWEIGIPQDA